MALIMVIQQHNVFYRSSERVLHLLETEKTASRLTQKPECLIVWEDIADGIEGKTVMDEVLAQMRIPHESCEVSSFQPEDLSEYTSLVLSVTNINRLQESLLPPVVRPLPLAGIYRWICQYRIVCTPDYYVFRPASGTGAGAVLWSAGL